MKFSTRQDIDVPADKVFRAVTNFDALERRALRRGAELQREDPPRGPGLGTKWKSRIKLRGRHRNIRSEVVRFDAPNGMDILSESGGLETDFRLEVLPLSPRSTRLSMSFELRPQSLTARLVVQSLKLARGTIGDRFDKAVAGFARELEDRHRDGAL